MTERRHETAAQLCWYPRRWRDRYGDELAALMEDMAGGETPTLRFKVSIALAGLREHIYGSGLFGDRAPRRIESELVRFSFCAPGPPSCWPELASPKLPSTLPKPCRSASRPFAQGAFDVVAALGVVGAILVMLGAMAAIPAFARFIRGGGWSTVRGHVLRAVALTLLSVGAVIPLSFWAHHLNELQRNGADPAYSGVLVIWAVLVAATLAQWTAAGVAATRRVDLPRGVLRLEAALAVALAGAMAAMTVAAGLWWGSMAQNAPWFLQGTAQRYEPLSFHTSARRDPGADDDLCGRRRLRRGEGHPLVVRAHARPDPLGVIGSDTLRCVVLARGCVLLLPTFPRAPG